MIVVLEIRQVSLKRKPEPNANSRAKIVYRSSHTSIFLLIYHISIAFEETVMNTYPSIAIVGELPIRFSATMRIQLMVEICSLWMDHNMSEKLEAGDNLVII